MCAGTVTNAGRRQISKQSTEQLKENSNIGLSFHKLDKDTVKLMVFSDASFASNSDIKLQLGYVVTTSDKSGHSNIAHYSSTKSRRVTRSVLAAELFAMANAFDSDRTFKLTLKQMYNLKTEMTMCTDTKSLFDLLIGITSSTEKRLIIDPKRLSEA